MIIGIAYDLKQDFAMETGRPDDWFEEYDSEETVQDLEETLQAMGHKTVRLGGGNTFLERIRKQRVDLVFNLAEGQKGRSREAHVPAILEMLDIPYTHSDPLTLALTLDKEMAKRVVMSEGVPTPAFTVIRNPSEKERVDLPFPLFVKPACEGSSKGIRSHSLVYEKRALKHEIERLLDDYGTPLLVEAFLPGREFTVGVLGNGSPHVLGILEIIPTQGPIQNFVYSVNAKRECTRMIRYGCPTDLPRSVLREIEKIAIRSFKVLGCRDVARIDIRLDERGKPKFLEANPLPGMARGYSDLVILAGLVGWSYDRLVGNILSHALVRYASRLRVHRDFPSVPKEDPLRSRLVPPPN